MPDFDAVATAIAGRFDAAHTTPPGGLGAIRSSRADIPNELPPQPCVLVFPDEGEFVAGNGTRLGSARWSVRFYYGQAADLDRDTNALRKWLTILVDQLKAATQLGGTIAAARLIRWRYGLLTFAGVTYSGLELVVETVTTEAWGATS